MIKKLVLFDLDGTLVTTGAAGRAALIKAVTQLYGKEPKFEHNFISGRTDSDNFSLVYQLIKHKKPSKTEVKKINDKYLELLPLEIQKARKQKRYLLIPGVKKLLEKLAKEKDIALGLGTGNVKRGAEIKLEPSGLLKYFTFGGYGEDGHTREEMLKAAVKRAEKKFKTKFTPDQVYIVGDTHRDVLAAKACGYHSAALTCGFGDPKLLQRAAAELQLDNFNDSKTFYVWLGLNTDPKGVKRGIYISPASAIEHVFFSRTGIDEDRLKMLKIKKYEDLPSGTIM